MSDEYDDFNLKVSKTAKISKEVAEIKQSVEQIKIRQETTESQVDQLDRSIHGAQYQAEIIPTKLSTRS